MNQNKNRKQEELNPIPDVSASFKFLFDHSSDAIFIHPFPKKRFRKFLEVNDIACMRLGYSRAELLEKTVANISRPIEKGALDSAGARLKIIKEKDAVYEMMHVPKTGSAIPVEIHSTVINYNGAEAILSIARDIRNRREVETELHKKNEFLSLLSSLNDLVNNGADLQELLSALGNSTQHLFNSYGATVFIVDESELVLQKLVLPKKLFKPVEELLGIKIPKVRIPVNKMSIYNKVFDRGEVLLINDAKEIEDVLADYGNITTVDSKIRQKIIKSVLPKLSNLFQIDSIMYAPLGTQEKPVGILGISSNQPFDKDDVDLFGYLALQMTTLLQRVYADRALKLSEDKFHRVIEQSHEGFVLVNEQGVVLKWNQALETLSGLSSTECIGQNIWDVQLRLNPMGEQATIYRNILKDIILGFLKNGRIPEAMVFSEQNFKHPNGTIHHLLYNLTAIKSAKGYKLCAIIRDITKHRVTETLLKASEARYRYFVDQTAEGFYRTEPVDPIDISLPEEQQIKQMYGQIRVVEANEIFAKMYGYPNTEAVRGVSLAELYGSYEKEQNLETLRIFVRNNYKIINAETEEIDQEGNPKYFLNNAVGIIEDDHLIAVWGTQRDITDKKKTELALIESEARFRKVSELTSDYAFGARVSKDMQITLDWITGALQKITGYTQEELKDRGGWETLILADDKYIPEEQFKMALKGKPGVVEYRIKDKKGTVRWMRDQTNPVWDKEEDRTIYIFGAVQDVTEQKIAQQDLVASEEKYKSLFQFSPDAIFIHPFKEKGFGNFIEVNEVAIRRLGYTRDELLTKTAKDISTPVDIKVRGSAKGRQALSLETNQVFETIHQTKEGLNIPVEIHSTVFNYKGEQAILSVARDVSERKRLEEQLRQAQKMEAVGQLAGGVAHDFNNLLTIISGYGELLLTDPQLSEKSTIKIQEILKAGDRAQKLTNQLLAFSRKQIFQPQIVQINEVISNSIKMYTRLIGEDIKIVLKMGKSMPSIKADPHQLEQILMNLLVNARDAIYANKKSTQTKLITIQTDIVEVDREFASDYLGMAPGSKILFSISDTGIGIEEGKIKQIFDPFYTTKGVGKGTGLGLSTVYGIVKQNRANVYVSSKLNHGTTFKIFWPPAKNSPVGMSEKKPDKTLSRGSQNLLLVEDDAGVRDFIVSALCSLGYDVQVTAGADEALKFLKAENKQIELVLTDIMMPDISGPELAKQIKKYFDNIPVIYISAYTDDHTAEQRALGSDIHYIQKPFSILELSEKIQQVLKR